MGALTHNGEVLQSLPANANQINFDKTGTNLNSTQVENAIKEVNTKVNTNTTDIDQLKSGLTAKSESITDGVFSNLLVKRCANIESISGEYVTTGQSLSANTWATIATVSSGFRPSTDRYLSAYICGANGALLAAARLTVKANGEISMCPSANIASGTAVFFVVTFVI